MKPISCVLFDWDGCLAATLSIWLDAYTDVFNENGITISKSEISEKVFGSLQAPMLFGVKDLNAFNNRLFEVVNDKMKTVPLNPHAKEILGKLYESGKKLGIVTSTRREALIPALHYHAIYNYFELILAQEDVVNHKPDPEIIFKAVEQIQTPLDETIIVGDSNKDIQAGGLANIRSVLYYPELHRMFYDLDGLKVYNPSYVISDFTELLSIVGISK